MANLKVLDGDGSAVFLKGTGAGTDLDPFILDRSSAGVGAVADAVVAAGAVGSLSAKLRRLTTDLAALIALLPATLGQKNKAGSLSVSLASDEDSLAATIADGADVALGAVADAAAAAGGTGTVGAKLRRISTQLPAALGQTTKAASLAVTLASDEDAVAATVAQLPAALGQTTKANSLPVTLPTDVGTLATSYAGPSWTSARATVSSADLSSIVDLTAAPTGGQKIVIDDIWLSAEAPLEVTISEETSATVVWSVFLPANGSIQFSPRNGLKLDVADKKARIITSGAGAIRGAVLYHSAA